MTRNELSAELQWQMDYVHHSEAFHLVHVVVQWVLDVVRLALTVWLGILLLSLFAWILWGLVWVLRKPVRCRMTRGSPSVGMGGNQRG